jgi:glycosyltransferase involved in cell wall biosynthesis
MWKNTKEISVILPTYNEAGSIRKVIEEFRNSGVVDEIIVVNNNAAPGTSNEVAGTDAREVFEAEQGYGAAIIRGFEEARGDYLVVCEPDDTFVVNDIFKLLAYSDDFDFVVGTRTHREMIWSGANMGFFLRWGNYVVAKSMEFLFNTTNLSDMGCTYRLIKREALDAMKGYFTVRGSHFGPEMMLLAIRLDIPFIQIPLNYKKRVGRSSVSGDFLKAFYLGVVMILLILRYRLFPPKTK